MNQSEDRLAIIRLYAELQNATQRNFPAAGGILEAPEERGVYVIYGPQDQVLHVGSTPKGERGIVKRLRDHMAASSSFTNSYLKGDGSVLRAGYSYRYVVVEDPRHRALLEAYAIGDLCPAHIGHGL